MKSKYLAIIVVLVTFIVATALSKSVTAAKITVTQTADKITIMGDKGEKIASENLRSAKTNGISLRFQYTALLPAFASYRLPLRK